MNVAEEELPGAALAGYLVSFAEFGDDSAMSMAYEASG